MSEIDRAKIAYQNAERLKEIMGSLVRHVHMFARDVSLTEAEWEYGINFLTRVGHMCSDTRQEFILLSDTLGLSTLVTAQNNKKPATCTEATVFGPFYVDDAPTASLGTNISNGMVGASFLVNGIVRGLKGEPILNARIEVWHADESGFYDVQAEVLNGYQGRAVLHADAEGR